MGNETSSMATSPMLLCRLARQGDAVALSSALARLTPAAKRAYLETQDDESTPLEIATALGHVECVRELVHAGADVNRRFRHAQTVLHLAVRTGKRAIVWLLVHTVGVERNAVDGNGDTPLLLAAHEGQHEAMEALLTSTGVDIFARNEQTGEDVFAVARSACAAAPAAEKPRYKNCIAIIEKMLGIRHGWLFEYTEGVAPGSGLWLWRKRYYMIYRHPDPEKVTISLFPPLRDDPASPTAELIYHGAHADMTTAVPTSLGMAAIPQSYYERPYRFALRCFLKSDPSTLRVLEFAATNQDELDLWRRLPARLTGATRPIQSTPTASVPRTREDENDLNTESLEESQQCSSSQASTATARASSAAHLDTNEATETEQPPAARASTSPSSISCSLAQLRLPTVRIEADMVDYDPEPDQVILCLMKQIAVEDASTAESAASQRQQQEEREDDTASSAANAPTLSASWPSLDSGASTSESEDAPAQLRSVNPPDATAGECIVCYDAIQSVACVPCGHVAMCVKCAQHVMLASRSCPVCRAHVSSTLKIFHV